MTLEDDFCDIITKARIGHAWSVEEVAGSTGLSVAKISALERGDRPTDRDEVSTLAVLLELHVASLHQIAFEQWAPQPTRAIPAIEIIHGAINGYAVKGYILHDAGEALLVDTGYNALAMIAWLESRRLRLMGICLTHGHMDHAEGIQQLLARWSVPVYLGGEDMGLLRWKPMPNGLIAPYDGQAISVGGFRVECCLTPGHTSGGICYRVDVDSQPVSFVGDTLFAGSIGRSNPRTLFTAHLGSVQHRVLKFPHDCILFPGHGPATTVREELTHNPFVACGETHP